MKISWIIDLIFIIVLAIILVIVNEFGLIALTTHKYIYIALLTTYFIGRKISSVLSKRNKKTI